MVFLGALKPIFLRLVSTSCNCFLHTAAYLARLIGIYKLLFNSNYFLNVMGQRGYFGVKGLVFFVLKKRHERTDLDDQFHDQ